MARPLDDHGCPPGRLTVTGEHEQENMSNAPPHVSHRTGARAKLFIGVVTVTVAALLVWSFVARREAGEAGEGAVAPAASHLAREAGDAAIILEAGAVARAGIATARVELVGAQTSVRGRARAVLVAEVQGEIVVDPARVTAVRAAVPGRLTSSRWPVLGEGVSAGRVLGQVSDARPLVAPRNGTVSRVGAQPGELVQAGQELLQLTDYTSLLVRLVWRSELSGAPPAVINVRSSNGATAGAAARLVGPGGDVDSLTRMPVYLYRLLRGWPGARPGLPVIGSVPDERASAVRASTAIPGDKDLLVPEAAVVQWQGLAWVYVERAAGHYVRTRVVTDRPVPTGYVVREASSALRVGNRVVIRGAQQLLSEEFRTQLPAGEGDADEKK